MIDGISVILTTLNRAESLRGTLESFCGLQPPGCEWELLVVDNGSTDHTRTVVASFTDRLPVRYVPESQTGLSRARNTGLHESRFSVLAFTDDDATLCESWLAAYVEAFTRQPEIGYAGGEISLDFSQLEILPDWAIDESGQVDSWIQARYALLDQKTLHAHPGIFYGKNMIYRRSIIEQHGMFDVRLGRSGKSLLAGEEFYLEKKLVRAGIPYAFVPDATVYHRIRPDELTVDYLMRHAIGIGKSRSIIAVWLDEDKSVNIARTWRCFRKLPHQLYALYRRQSSRFQRVQTGYNLRRCWSYEWQMLRMLISGQTQKR